MVIRLVNEQRLANPRGSEVCPSEFGFADWPNQRPKLVLPSNVWRSTSRSMPTVNR
ncbi:Uncharacterised protein [Amycolatopsis camponoti]|uniref:Uncharacterized protein n=1 Tax=Amycolatopsis camponoti TaxID=2606593 RepID=A0A6I8LWU1_9PSEU|nr:Uncharacterised protein [Amycolatopsis camponoti]